MMTDDTETPAFSRCLVFRPLVAADCVVFLGEGKETRVLLIRRKNEPFQGQWAFPGGLLDEGESIETCAARELEEETRLTGVTLTQLGVWSEPGRDPRGPVVTVAFTGRAEAAAKNQIEAADDAAAAEWVLLTDVKSAELAFDHADILAAARSRKV